MLIEQRFKGCKGNNRNHFPQVHKFTPQAHQSAHRSSRVYTSHRNKRGPSRLHHFYNHTRSQLVGLIHNISYHSMNRNSMDRKKLN